MDNLDELDNKLEELKKTRDQLIESLNKNSEMGYPSVNKGEEEDEEDKDKKKDKKMIEQKMDEHNEKKHGEDEDEDTAMEKDEGIASEGRAARVKAKESKANYKQTLKDYKPGDNMDNVINAATKHGQNNASRNEIANRYKEATNFNKSDELIKFDNNQQWDLNKARVETDKLAIREKSAANIGDDDWSASDKKVHYRKPKSGEKGIKFDKETTKNIKASQGDQAAPKSGKSSVATTGRSQASSRYPEEYEKSELIKFDNNDQWSL